MDADNSATKILLRAVDKATQDGRKLIFTTYNSDREREAVAKQVKAILKTAGHTLELRSIRRGGLQYMAVSGMPLEKILLFSKHRSMDMLMRYLDWGAVSTAHQKDILEGVTILTDALDLQET